MHGQILVAHGTRNPRGVSMIAAVADAVSEQAGPTRVAFVDVLGPSPAEILSQLRGPAALVPAFLASGYHVRTDLPREITESGHSDVRIAPAIGPDPVLAGILAERLTEAGWVPGDAVVLAAAGSSDERALRDVRRAAVMLADRLHTRVDVGYIATAQPRVGAVVDDVRRRTGKRVFIASYLLADGLFHNRLFEAGADGVAAPIGVHDELVSLICSRFRAARALSVPSLRR
ncbi:sirohydrochlorin chelatase [Hoyosella sp. YIM 151337]|uniref:sirohydrochlorin chelatase n=1 Tax=Hoyosella sp. YIM 151337 TaxID=2992742 RepID=UPI002236823E|nr:sirohydrochlorin chelatase [Hoyosella sp. YIM 151337]MCW4352267.1 sirohydrochlorin chelatase [Hoyosella sp. YIM 151337]